jgi:hypothetical protein
MSHGRLLSLFTEGPGTKEEEVVIARTQNGELILQVLYGEISLIYVNIFTPSIKISRFRQTTTI